MQIQIPEVVSVVVATLLAIAEFRRFRNTSLPAVITPPPADVSVELEPLKQRIDSLLNQVDRLRKEQKRQRWNDFILAAALLTIVVMEILPS